MSLDLGNGLTLPDLATAEVLHVSGGFTGKYNIAVRCPHCMAIHGHSVVAEDRERLLAAPRHQWARCSNAERHIAGVPCEPKYFSYVLNGLDELNEHDMRINYLEADPHSRALSGDFSREERMAKALELIESAPGLIGFTIEHSESETMLRDRLKPGRVLILSWEPNYQDPENIYVTNPEHLVEIVLQQHEMIGWHYRYDSRKDVKTMDDPGYLLRGVYRWLHPES